MTTLEALLSENSRLAKALDAAMSAQRLSDELSKEKVGHLERTVTELTRQSTNDAFAALPAGLVDKLLLPENKDILVAILTYPVVSGKVMAADVTAGDVPSVQGEPITITTDGGVKVNNANVTATDVAASNGVIHVIDAVILPPSLDISTL
jgi:uncharacterized surface protein with fasciclin (FAS1) repeats